MNKNRGFITLPGAIIIAGALIAIALIVINKPPSSTKNPDQNQNSNTPQLPSVTTGIPPVTAEDHILGNPNAPIKLIEYSDLSCVYCKQFDPTMTSLMDSYGPTGKVAWIYRQLPAYKAGSDGFILHPNSGIQAEALECAGALGGNPVFFNFKKRWFNLFPEDGASRPAAIDKQQLINVAKDVGLNVVAFNNCMSTGRFKDKVEADFQSALSAGVTGTPYTVVITPSGSKIPLTGSQSYSSLKNMIDILISSL